MRFMVILKGSKEMESAAPTAKMFDDMTKFNEQLVDAGVMVGGEGLHPADEGTRVSFKNGKATVTKGATGSLIAGFWLWKVKSVDEAIDWVKRIPNAEGEIELRQIFETEEFKGIMSPEAMEKEKDLYKRIADQNAKAASGK